MENRYPPVTEEQKKDILAIFGEDYPGSFGINDFEFEIKALKDGYHIKVSQMYDYVNFRDPYSTLTAMMEICRILNCKDGNEVDRNSHSGCETCDYGSSYEIEWRFW